MQSKAKKVVFLSGHGEKSIQDSEKTGYSLARGLLEKENYQVEEINLLSGKGLPAETRCLVIPGPKKPLFPGRNRGPEKIHRRWRPGDPDA